MTDIKAAIRAARLPEKSVLICLRGDLVADYEATERALAEAGEQAAGKLAGSGTTELVQRLDGLREQMREHTVEFRVRAMPRKAWREFIAEHPPRQLDDGTIHKDDVGGVNEETFPPDLVRRSVIEPEMDADDWLALLDVLTDRQFGALSDAAWVVNRRDVNVPFSPAASPQT